MSIPWAARCERWKMGGGCVGDGVGESYRRFGLVVLGNPVLLRENPNRHLDRCLGNSAAWTETEV